MTIDDRNTLRALAARVREKHEARDWSPLLGKWRALNDGEAREPLIIMKYHGAGDDIYPALTCTDDIARGLEGALAGLLTEADWADDRVINKTFEVSLWFGFTSYGIDAPKRVTALDADGVPTMGYQFNHVMENLDEDFHMLKRSTWDIAGDIMRFKRVYDTAQEAFGDILDVVYRMPSPSYAPMNKLVCLMGMENLLYALSDSPENFKRALDMLTDDMLACLDEIEAKGLAFDNTDSSPLNQDSYGYATKLDGEGWACAWGYANSQESVGISPDMFDEFVFPSIERFAARFGLFAYGCCEPVHTIWDKSLSRLKNLRKVSVSPWCDEEWIADRLRARNIVYHRKPSPNGFAMPSFDEDALYKQLSFTARVASGCPLEITFRDITTVRGDKRRLNRAVEIARRAIGENWRP